MAAASKGKTRCRLTGCAFPQRQISRHQLAGFAGDVKRVIVLEELFCCDRSCAMRVKSGLRYREPWTVNFRWLQLHQGRAYISFAQTPEDHEGLLHPIMHVHEGR